MSIAIDGASGWPAQHKQGWLPGDIDPGVLRHEVSVEEQRILFELADRWRATRRPITAMQRPDFSHPTIDAMLAERLAFLKTGPGLVVMAGLHTPERSLDDLRLVYWGIGLHFGTAVSQNRQGELLGEVRVRSDVVARRAYGHAGTIMLHTDRIDILSLCCASKPISGGANLFVSGLTIWDAVERERPDLFARLARGFRQNRLGEHRQPGDESTAYRVPVFAAENGLRSVLFSGNASLDHQRRFFADELTAADEEALTFLAEVRDRPSYALRATLDIGEAVFLNNHELLHSRERFEDGEMPDRKRLLLRLWLQGAPVRPKPDVMTVMRNASGLQGIDPRPADLELA